MSYYTYCYNYKLCSIFDIANIIYHNNFIFLYSKCNCQHWLKEKKNVSISLTLKQVVHFCRLARKFSYAKGITIFMSIYKYIYSCIIFLLKYKFLCYCKY